MKIINRWLTGLLLIAVFSSLMSLGFWQLDRARQKQQLLDVRAEQGSAEPVSLETLIDPSRSQFMPVVVQGHWQDEWTFFLDNRIRQGRLGYNVFSLFMSDQNLAVLVDRGWLPFTNGPRQFAAPKPSNLQNRVMGYVYLPGDYRVVDLPEIELNKAIPLPGLNLTQFQAFFQTKGIQLMPLVVRQTFPESEQGLLREWAIAIMTPDRHIGYAIQWFALATALLVLALIVRNRELVRNRALKSAKKI